MTHRDPVTGIAAPMRPEYGTPAAIGHVVREFLGGVDLDPATSVLFNSHGVQAANIYTEESNGLDQPWFGSVYLNPPGGRSPKGAAVKKAPTKSWWKKLVAEYLAQNIREAVYMSFALDSFQWSQGKNLMPILEFPTAVFAKRIKFTREENGVIVDTKAPNRPCAITWLPPLTLSDEEVRECFSCFVAMLNETEHKCVAVYK